ncbi:extracellular medium-chain-length polyhydroxyalkanoate depolymerase [Stenotrophobium rhamnosiphilum]|uniref:Plasmid partitioning protein n=1 Tax=Stenotrophobium rhamnosiphilum TaxID=2029166 RepID=A0A2T5MCI0_9GAMM|nr:plasmid partitioning protein [Stenotrophobium rhamnosiphilum]PTU30273.1 plasmid partitioning protein [Stenotrophobium rhamnosiphilum]
MRRFLFVAALALTTANAQAGVCTDTVTGTSHTLSCPYKSKVVTSSYGIPRTVRYQVPAGTPPIGGWPAVLLFQPSVFPIFWSIPDYTPAGAYHQVETIAALLDAGYAVVEPPTNYLRGFQYWDTNQPGMDTAQPYTTTDDYGFLNKVFNGVVSGQYGPINGSRLYATGMSSGGYNTSRMAVSFQGRFRALAVQSGSYASCLGFMCTIPSTLPANHPATLFLHGSDDNTVPVNTMEAYYNQLQSQGIDTKKVIAPGLSHEYLPQAPSEIVEWFNHH